MGLKEDITTEVDKILTCEWEIRNGQKVPEPADLALGNSGVRIEATVLYADLLTIPKLVFEPEG